MRQSLCCAQPLDLKPAPFALWKHCHCVGGTMVLLSESRKEFFRYMCINCGKELILDFRPAPGEPLRGEQADAGVRVTSFTRVLNGVEHSVTVETLSNYHVCVCSSVWHEYVGRRVIYH